MTTKIKSGVIADQAVGTTQLADDGVTAAKIGADQVGASEIATDAVGASEIAAGAVGTSEIADGSIGLADLSAAATPMFTKSYSSGNQTITAAGALTLAHGLGVMPTLLQARLKCLTAEGGYSIGDEVVINPAVNSVGAAAGLSLVPDATNLNVRYAAGAPVFTIVQKTTGAAFSVTLANWALILKAWA